MRKWLLLVVFIWLVHFYHPQAYDANPTGDQPLCRAPGWVHEVYQVEERPTLYRSYRSNVWKIRTYEGVKFLPVQWTWIEKVKEGE